LIETRSGDLLVEVRDGIAVLTLNRPQRGNAFTPQMHSDLTDFWAEVGADPSIRVVIVTGAGDRHFCTGGDVADMGGANADGWEGWVGRGPLREEMRYTARMNEVWKPVICAVNGLVAGGGLHFVVDADIVIASERASFMDNHTSLGLVGAIENIGLARRLPLGTALRMSLVGSSYRLSAQRAYELGLVEEVVSPGELMPMVEHMAEAIKRNSPTAMSLTQQALWRSMNSPLSEALEYGWALVRLHWSHPDFSEGLRAFAEKREPRWVDG